MKKLLLICLCFTAMHVSHSQDEHGILNQIDSINALAMTYYNDNKIMQSINTIDEAIKLSKSIDDNYGHAVANFTLGKIYSYMNNHEDAEKCFSRMLKASLKAKDNYLIANAYIKLGEAYKRKGSIDKSLPFFKEALLYAQKKDITDSNNQDKQQVVLFEARTSLAATYIDLENPKEAFAYLLRAESTSDKYNFNPYNETVLSYQYGRYFILKDAYFKAADKFEEATEFLEDNGKENSIREDLLMTQIYEEYAIALSAMGNNDKAYQTLVKHNEYREKILNEEIVKQENIAKSKFAIADYKRQAQYANSEMLTQEGISEKMERVNFIMVFAGILLLISFIVLAFNYVSKKKLSNIMQVKYEQLQLAKEEAEKSSKLKTKFISNVTHELRTPLYGVVGLTSLLLKSNNLDEKDSKFLKSLKFSGDYLLNLINDILQFGKIESQEVELHYTAVNIRTLAGNIIDSFEYRIQESNNQVILKIDESVPEYVKCDNVRLSQILINLIGNSIKFTQNGKVVLGVKTLKVSEEEITLKFSVKDNGPGVPEDQQKRIFDNFSQLNEEININYQGTGLGLSIAKNLIELFDSKIELESELGYGSEFSFKLNLDIEHAIEINNPSKKVYGKAITIEDNCKVLVAEDNKINQIVTQNILKKGNFLCEVVENGLEALKATKNNDYDLILMDLNMPVMNGSDATVEIRKFNPHIPIIALTAADIDEVKNNLADIGFNDIITKPFDNFEFYQVITKNIYRSKQKLNTGMHKVS